MKKFLAKIFLFFGILSLSYPIFVWSAHIYDVKFNNIPKRIKESKNGYGFMANRIKEAEQVDQADVLILGSSLAYRLIDTRSFDTLGLKAINLGSSSQTPLQTEFLIDRYLEQINPKLIIWDISPSLFSNSGFESFIDLVSNFGFHPTFVKHALTIKDIDAFHTLTFVLIDEFLHKEREVQLETKTNKEVYVQGGFVQTSKMDFNRAKPLKNTNLDLKSYQIDAFERTFDKLIKRQLILVMAPIRKEDYNLFVGLDSFLQIIENKKKVKENLQFYNFNDSKFLEFASTALFYDEFHLNQKGVEIYNKMLLDSISNNFPEVFF